MKELAVIPNCLNKYNPEKILIFNFCVKGNITFDSDVDFFIIKNTKKSHRKRNIEVSRMLMDRDVPIDILVYTPAEVKERIRLGDFFIENILNTGKQVYAK